MEPRTSCKGCMEPDPDYEAQVERLWSRMVLREGEAVSEERYLTRLSACQACDALMGGSTCRHCGCLVKWRAKLTISACPYPGSPKW
jgi:hypothetical protein